MREFDAKDFGMGCIASTYDARDYVLSNVATAVSLPESFKVNHSNIKNQGAVGSCVAHSVCELLEASSKNTEKYSTNWVYGYRPDGYYIGKGMMVRDACKTVVEKGYVLYEDFSGNTEMSAVMDRVNSNLELLLGKAETRKAIAYNRLKNAQQIKEAIYSSGLPVLIVCRVSGRMELDDNYILQYDENNMSGCHCMVCYGWNEYGLLIQNSWGKTFGKNGTFILPYEYPIVESWSVSCDTKTNISVKPRLWWLRKLIQAIIKLFTEK